MPRLKYTVEDLANEIRRQIDELNADSVSTEEDILPTANRAQDYAFDILTRKYQEPILQYTTLTLVGGTQEYSIPENVFEDRIQKVEIYIPSGAGATYREVQRLNYRQATEYESASQTNVPNYYVIYGRKIRFIPIPSGTYNARVWYLQAPEKLVLPQGRITLINTASNYLVVDSAGSSLSTEADNLQSYVNVIDGQTGEIRGTLQIQSINSSNKITFRTTPQRTSVLNRTVSSSLSGLTLSLDDYLAPVDGTCVPYFGRPTTNFIIQYTVAELTRKLGGEAATEEQILDKFEKQLEKTWAGRETSLRVRKKSQNWGVPTRRLWFE